MKLRKAPVCQDQTVSCFLFTLILMTVLSLCRIEHRSVQNPDATRVCIVYWTLLDAEISQFRAKRKVVWQKSILRDAIHNCDDFNRDFAHFPRPVYSMSDIWRCLLVMSHKHVQVASNVLDFKLYYPYTYNPCNRYAVKVCTQFPDNFHNINCP